MCNLSVPDAAGELSPGGAGGVVVDDVADGVAVRGVPAKSYERTGKND